MNGPVAWLAVAFYLLCALSIVAGLVGCLLAVGAGLVGCALWVGKWILGLCVEIAGRLGDLMRAMRRPSAPDPSQRAGDRERVRALNVLRNGYADGRLDLRELEARTDAALAARTGGDLSPLLADLAVPVASRRGPRVHELVAGIALLCFFSAEIRLLGACLILSALFCERMRAVALAFVAGLLALVSAPAALILGAAVAWEQGLPRLAARCPGVSGSIRDGA